MTSKFDRVRDGAEIEPNLNEWAIQQVMTRVYDESYPIALMPEGGCPFAPFWNTHTQARGLWPTDVSAKLLETCLC